MEFNKEKHIAKMQPHADKIIAELAKDKITFEPTDGGDRFENVIFKHEGKTIKISHHSFYGFSRIACVCRDGKEKNSSETIEVTDAMFMNNFMYACFKLSLGVK